MFSQLLLGIFSLVLNFFDAEDIREAIDDFFDKIEQKLAVTLAGDPNNFKANALKIAIGQAREYVGIPDDYNGDED